MELLKNVAQLDANENSGSITVGTGGPERPQLAVIWERKRGGPIKVRARSAGTPEFPLDQADRLFRQVDQSSGANAMEQFHLGGQLCYDDWLPWRGEQWLNDTLRLGPPTQQDDEFLLGPRIILVNDLISGQIQPVPLKSVQRPDFSQEGLDGTQTEVYLPQDIVDLWKALEGLSPDRRRQFLQVGSMWQLALSLGHGHQTASFALIVASCEALKPPDSQFRNHNVYHVVEALLGEPADDLLQKHWFRAQDVRNAHFHSGEFRGAEFVRDTMMSSFQDPTFGQSHRTMYRISQAAIIEWLRRCGSFTMPPLKRKRS